MTRYWFQPGMLRGLDNAQALAALEPLGVRLRPAAGQLVYFRDEETGYVMKEIGSLFVDPDGTIEILPCRGHSPRDLRVLLGSAEEAFRRKPSKATGWHFRRRGPGKSFWYAEIQVRADDPTDFPVLVAMATVDAKHGSSLERRAAASDDAGSTR